MHSSGWPRNEVANTRRVGSSCMMLVLSPRAARNSAPFLLRESAPPVFVSAWMTVARPVPGSSFITLLASLFANSSVPWSPTMGPSALLPSHDHTTCHAWPAAKTPGIAPGRGNAGGGGGDGSFCSPPNETGAGAFWHFDRTADSPGFCQDCRLLPRGKADEGL